MTRRRLILVVTAFVAVAAFVANPGVPGLGLWPALYARFFATGSAAEVRRSTARSLLEEGRAAEARLGLGDLDDAESNWLLSRAYLVEGAFEKARTAVVRAGDFGHDTPLAPEPCRYVGARRCATCHAAIYRDQQNSRHATTIVSGEALTSVPLPRKDVEDPVVPTVSHRFERSGDQISVSVAVDGKLIQAMVDYVLGSGRHGMTMLAHQSSGRRVSLRVSYYSEVDGWALTTGFEPHPTDPESFLGMPLDEETFRGCLNCHTTRFPPSRGRDSPETFDKGIGCERCHGPADHHLRAVDAGFPQLAIARPKLATPAQRMILCSQCHGAGGQLATSDPRPSDPRFVRFQSSTLTYSRCYSESRGRLDCVTCHDPHKTLETRPEHYERRCLHCHEGGRPVKSRETKISLAAACTVSPASGCVSCHMPKVEKVMPFTDFTDHHIRIQRRTGTAASSSVAH